MYKCYFCKQKLEGEVYFIGNATVASDESMIGFHTSDLVDAIVKCFCRTCFRALNGLKIYR